MNKHTQPSEKKIDALESFLTSLHLSLNQNRFHKMILSKYRGADVDLVRLEIKPITIRGHEKFSVLYRYKTKDVTKNFDLDTLLTQFLPMIGKDFADAHLFSSEENLQLTISKKGQYFLVKHSISNNTPIKAMDSENKDHNRHKNRLIHVTSPYLTALGITNAAHEVVPSMSKKWKQINKFIEIFSHGLDNTALKNKKKIRVLDFGAGKGYLTFAIHDFLVNQLQKDATVIGLEIRSELVKFCNDIIENEKISGLTFDQGDVQNYLETEKTDVMIALHACDTATDYAIYKGIKAKAEMILCAPCCHKQLRPQIHCPTLLKPLLNHGIHMTQEAEMLTDSLRSLLLESEGYDTQVIEFISLEHTQKNKMILATKRQQQISSPRKAEMLKQLQALKAFYGVTEQCLETLLLRNEHAI